MSQPVHDYESNWVPDDHKFKEMLLHIVDLSEGDERLGGTKLNKLLFFADFLAYLRFGKPISGQPYQKLDHGPAPTRMLPLVRELIESEDLLQYERRYGDYVQTRFVPRRSADLSVLESREVALIDEVVTRFQHYSAGQISDKSHQFVGWDVAGRQETIPYASVLVGSREPTFDEIEYGESLTARARESLGI